LDPSRGRTVGSEPPHGIAYSRFQSLREFLFNCRSREVSSTKGSCKYVAHSFGGTAWLIGGENIERREKWKWVTGGGHMLPRKGVNLLLTIANHGFTKEEHKDSTLQLVKLQVARGARVRPSQWLFVEVLARKGLYPYHTLKYHRFGVESLQFTKSRDCESQKVLVLKAQIVVMWRRTLTAGARSAGGVFVKDLWIGFVEGFSKEPKDSLRLEEIRMILSRSWLEGWGFASFGIREHNDFFSFCSREKGEIL
jgi:hypothetical protein